MENSTNEKQTIQLPIIEGIIVGGLEVNCYILGCPEHKEAVVIDPGDNAGEILGRLKALGVTIKKIINTHAHADHVGANHDIKESASAPLLIHEFDSEYLVSSVNGDMAAFYGLKASPPADVLLKDGDIIELCSHYSLKVIHTPGHTPGGICLSCNGVLFSGDTLFANSIGRTDLPGGSHPALLKSIKTRLFPLDNKTRVLPGHGPESTIENEKEFNPFLR